MEETLVKEVSFTPLSWIFVGIQVTSMIGVLILGITIAVHRKAKVISVSPWFMLEFMLLGSFLLYSLYLMKTVFNDMKAACFLEPWLREIGFISLYGTIAIKLYLLLVECRTRKAHRWVVRNHDMLKYLGCMLLVASVYLISGTVSTLQHWKVFPNDNRTLNDTPMVAIEEKQIKCPVLWWHLVNFGAEMLFISVGVYIAASSRNTQSDRSEYYRLLTALLLEFFVSTAYTILCNISWTEETLFDTSDLEFIRSQATVTVVLFLQFAPKVYVIYHSKRPPGCERPSDSEVSVGINAPPAPSSEHQIPEVFLLSEARSVDVYIKQNGEVDVRDEEIIDLDPDIVKAELKRVYTQLYVLRSRSVLSNNPHLIKKRSRKLTRKFSRMRDQGTEKLGSRRPCRRRDGRITDEKEESVISTEGFSMYISEG